jgi:hypothetical protein
MKLTRKAVKQEVETTEMICEIAKDEFSKLGAKVAARIVMEHLDGDESAEALLAALSMTSLLAEFCAELETELFDPKEPNDKKEEK